MNAIQELFSQHQHVWFLISGISFVIELSIMGLSGPLLFFALGTLITGILVSLNIVNTVELEILTAGVVSTITAVLLWKPLKKYQNAGGGADNSSDMIGLEVKAASDISKSSGQVRYSGVNWSAKLAENDDSMIIPEGCLCKISQIQGNILIVTPITKSQ